MAEKITINSEKWTNSDEMDELESISKKDDRDTKIKEKWSWLYNQDGSLNEEAVLNEIMDYDFIIGEVPLVYARITDGLLSKPNYKAEIVLREFEELFWDKGFVIDDIKEMIKSAKTLEELKEELENYLTL